MCIKYCELSILFSTIFIILHYKLFSLFISIFYSTLILELLLFFGVYASEKESDSHKNCLVHFSYSKKISRKLEIILAAIEK